MKLNRAYVCINNVEDGILCNEIFESNDNGLTVCPACGSTTCWPIESWLQPPEDLTLEELDLRYDEADDKILIISRTKVSSCIVLSRLDSNILSASINRVWAENLNLGKED